MLGPALFAAVALGVGQLPRCRARKDQLIGMVSALLDLFYFALVETALSALRCETVWNDSEYQYLVAAPYIECFKRPHSVMLPLAVLCFLTYGVGFPLWIARRLRAYAGDLGSPAVADLRGLIDPIKPAVTVWRVALLEYVRRLLLAVLLAWLGVHDGRLPLFIWIWLIVSCLVSLLYKRFVCYWDNAAEFGSLMAIWAVYSVRILHTAERSDLFAKEAVNQLLVLGQVLMILTKLCLIAILFGQLSIQVYISFKHTTSNCRNGRCRKGAVSAMSSAAPGSEVGPNVGGMSLNTPLLPPSLKAAGDEKKKGPGQFIVSV
jgi:hypothetical protein